ncbi:helix-turn-helix transcriptional regulator [Bittarella massiliensis]|nr:helix-turn-helix transcriptional regulator [Bittarella massiliensis (ex Durand et al. 2017)]MBO1680387.1 helix-turn-helix transcriptional regulator [Bittarella massiliensis (ex Durand et al. 2017)]
MPTLGERLTFLQAERQLLKKDIAAAAGLSLMGYYRYERGERQPPADVLIALADYFDVSLDYLVGRSDDPTRR